MLYFRWIPRHLSFWYENVRRNNTYNEGVLPALRSDRNGARAKGEILLHGRVWKRRIRTYRMPWDVDVFIRLSKSICEYSHALRMHKSACERRERSTRSLQLCCKNLRKLLCTMYVSIRIFTIPEHFSCFNGDDLMEKYTKWLVS